MSSDAASRTPPDSARLCGVRGEPEARVGRTFIAAYAAAYLATSLVFIAPLLVTLALKVNSLVGTERAPNSLSLIAGVGSLVAMVGNPLFGRLSDRTTSRLGMRRPWLLIGLTGGTFGILVVALAPAVWVVLVGWCLAQLFFNAMLAALVAVLPDQVPVEQRGTVAGVLGVCLPTASVGGTYVVKVFTGNELAMFLAPCAIGAFFIVLFAIVLDDRRLAPEDKPPWSLAQLLGTYYVSPRKHPDFAWAFASRFMFLLAYAFLVTYQAYYLLEHLGSDEDDVPQQIFLGTLTQAVFVVAASLVGGRLSDRTGRRKLFVAAAAVIYGVALFLIAVAADFDGFLVGNGDRRPGLRAVPGRRPRTGRRRAARAQTAPPRTSGSSTSPGHCRSPSRRRWRRWSWGSAGAATRCCTASRGCVPSWPPPPSCP